MSAQALVQAQRRMARMGRGTDSEIGHLTPGEVVVPREVLAQMGTQESLRRGFAAAGIDMGRYTVGGGDDSRNPRTGMREYRVDGHEGAGHGGTGEYGGGDGDTGETGGDGGSVAPGGGFGPAPGGETEGGLSVDPDTGGYVDAGDGGGEGETQPVAPLPQQRPVQPLPDDFENIDLAWAQLEDIEDLDKTLEKARDRELSQNDLLGIFGAAGNILEGILDKGIENVYGDLLDQAEDDPFGAISGLRERHWSKDTEQEDRGGDVTLPGDTVPGDTTPGDTETDPDSPDSVFADVTPWEGVPDITQASLPEGWLGQAQGSILAAHQSAVRLGAW